MSEHKNWVDLASDMEIVEKFQREHDGRTKSLWGYRVAMRRLYPRLLKILLDGLQRQHEKKVNSEEWIGKHHKDCILVGHTDHENYGTPCVVRDPS